MSSPSLYLTGGTALSRFHFNHRYSDDLDFFVNAAPDFRAIVQKALIAIRDFNRNQGWQMELKTGTDSDFVQVFIQDADSTTLKIDFVNDISYRVGPTEIIRGVSIDSIENMLTNKIGALYRFAARDLADLAAICLHYSFHWPVVFEHVAEKVLGIGPDNVAHLLRTAPPEVRDEVRWSDMLLRENLLPAIATISYDILKADANSLAPFGARALHFESR